MSRQRVIVEFLIVCSVFLLSTLTYAETVTILGVKFQVANIQEASDEEVLFSDAGETTLVKKEQLPFLVIKKKLKGADPFLIKEEDAHIFLVALSLSERAEWGELIPDLVVACMESIKKGTPSDAEALNKLVQEGKIPSTLLLETKIQSSQLYLSLVHIFILRDPDWISTHLLERVYVLGEILKERCLEDFFYQITLSQYDEARRILTTYQAFFPSEKALYFRLGEFVDDIKNSQEREPQLQSKNRSIDLLLRRFPTDVQVKDRIVPLIAARVHQVLLEQIEKGNLEDALGIIAIVPQDFYTLDVQNIFVSVLVKCLEKNVSLSDHVLPPLITLSMTNPFVKEQLEVLLKTDVVNSLQNGSIDFAEARFLALVRIPGVSSKVKADAMLVLAEYFSHKGLYARARSILNQLPSDAFFRDHLQGVIIWFSTFAPLPLIFFFCISAGGYLIHKKTRRLKKANDDEEQGIEEQMKSFFHQSAKAAPSSSVLGGAQEIARPLVRKNAPPEEPPPPRFTPEEEEYLRSLKQFGLPVSATLQDIKARYRILMKSFHPDNRPGEAKASDDFLETKRLYDRLLELRKNVRDFSALE